jgi:uncharacterized protein YegL
MSEQVLPFYVVCDESYSMVDDIDALNQYLAELHQAIGTDPVVSDKTRFCVIAFSGTAEVLLPLSELSEVEEMPGLTAKSSTSYGAAFALLRDTIERDVAMLKGDGHMVYRPAVFFLSDGLPTDESSWAQSHQRLTDPGWGLRPNIVAFGIGDTDADTIRRVGTFKAFIVNEGVSPTSALHEFAKALTKSIVKSGTSLAQDGSATLQVPDKIEGFTELKVDPV